MSKLYVLQFKFLAATNWPENASILIGIKIDKTWHLYTFHLFYFL